MEKGIIIIIGCFATLCVSIFSSFARKGAWFSSGLNLAMVFLLTVCTLYMGEMNAPGIIAIAYPDNIALSMVGFFTVLLIFYGEPGFRRESRVACLHSLVFLMFYVLLGTHDWLNVFVCYKLVALAYYSLLDTKDDRTSKNLFVFEMLRSVVLISAIMFYFLGTWSFNFYQPMVANQDFFLVSLIFFLLFAAMELGLLPFHFWLEDLFVQGKDKKMTFYVLIRKIIFSYFLIVTLEKLSISCEPGHKEIFVNVVKGYILVNIVAGSFLLLVQKDMVEIISSFAMINISLACLCIVLEKGILSKGHLLFYLFCTVLPLLGISLINNAVCAKTGERSLEKFCAVVANSRRSGIYFSIFLLALAGFPLTMGFSGKLLLYLDFLEIAGKGLFAGLVFMIFSSMQTGFKIVGHVFAGMGDKIKDEILDKKHLWVHSVLAFLVILGGVAPSLFLTMHD